MVRCGPATLPPGCGRAAAPARPGGQATQSLLGWQLATVSSALSPQPGAGATASEPTFRRWQSRPKRESLASGPVASGTVWPGRNRAPC